VTLWKSRGTAFKPALSSFVSGELLEGADLALRDGEFLATLVEGQVSVCIVLPERIVSFPGFPEIARHIRGGTKGIAQEDSSLIPRSASKKPDPIAGRSVYAYKPFVTSWLDIELPEG
jgi:hypothetical protein